MSADEIVQAGSIEHKFIQLADAIEERAELVESKDAWIAKLQDEIRTECLTTEKTIKTRFGSVTYRKGSKRTSYDPKKLAGLELVYPEIAECKKTTETKPSAAIKLGV